MVTYTAGSGISVKLFQTENKSLRLLPHVLSAAPQRELLLTGWRVSFIPFFLRIRASINISVRVGTVYAFFKQKNSFCVSFCSFFHCEVLVAILSAFRESRPFFHMMV